LKIRTFKGIRVYTLNTYRFNRGFAITIPGIGILLGLRQINNTDLLRHEFGHILQLNEKGFMFFWFRIAPVSLMSAIRNTFSKKHIHMHTWTEWSANKLSFDYFNKPADRDFNRYPSQVNPQT